MREIKLRAWDKECEMMIYPKSYYSPKYKDGHIAEMYNIELNEFITIYNFDNNYVLMQYTGLKDKNGTEIYEGDIVQAVGFTFKPKKVVEWRDEFAGFAPFIELVDFEYNGCFDGDIEVVGNIYENFEENFEIVDVNYYPQEIPQMEGTQEALDNITIKK